MLPLRVWLLGSFPWFPFYKKNQKIIAASNFLVGTYQILRFRDFQCRKKSTSGTTSLGYSSRTHVFNKHEGEPCVENVRPTELYSSSVWGCTETNPSGPLWRTKQRLLPPLGTEIPDKLLSMSRWTFSGL